MLHSEAGTDGTVALLGPLGPLEMVVIVVSAILVFGPRLAQVAAEAARLVDRVSRSLRR